MTSHTGIFTDPHFYVDLIAIAAALLTLLPIYKDFGRKFFAIALAVLFVCVAGLSAWIRQMHQNELAKVRDHITRSLEAGPKTFDELGRDLNFNEVGKMSEALDAMLDESESKIGHDDVRLQNCDSSILVVVSRYYVKNLPVNKR